MKLSRLAMATLALNISSTTAAIIAWSAAMSGRTVTLIALAGLLGLVAFSLMWVHYVSNAIRDIWFQNETAGEQYNITRKIVLGAILLHPALIILYLYQNNYGLPPTSYQAYLGDSKTVFVFLGIIALTIFLAFEFKRLLVKYNVWHCVLHANFIAMFAVLIHGFQLGSVMAAPWYFLLWCFYGTSLFIIAAWRYMRYYKDMPIRRLIAISIVVIAAVIATMIALQVMSDAKENNNAVRNQSSENSPTKDTDTRTPDMVISKSDLAANNGRSGSKCWLAIDGTVYDVTSSSEWVNGQHVPSRGMASCGRDLTQVLSQSPHGKSVLGTLPVIGTLE